jgi:ABC-type nickel/cobalt efflux system permease component RcnA
MKPDPVLVLSISSGLFIVTFVLLLRWTSRFTYKRFLKYYIVRFRQMREEDKIAAAMAIGFSVVYGIMLVIYTQ